MAAGQAAAVARPAVLLMDSVLKQMAYSKGKVAVGLLLLVCLVGSATAVGVKHFWPPGSQEEFREPAPDPLAEPLSPGAVARLGTHRWWQPEGIETLRFSPDGRLLVTNRLWGLPFRIREVATGKQLPQFAAKDRTGFDENTFYDVRAILFSPDSETLAVIASGHDRDGRGEGEPLAIALWDVATGRQVLSLAEWNRRCEEEPIFLFANSDPSFTSSPDSKELVVALNPIIVDDKPNVLLVDAATGKEVRRVQYPDLKSIVCVALSPDGKMLAAGDGEGKLALLDAQTGRTIRVLKGTGVLTRTEGPVSPPGLSFSSDGKLLIADVITNSDELLVLEFDVTTAARNPTGEGSIPHCVLSTFSRRQVRGRGNLRRRAVGESGLLSDSARGSEPTSNPPCPLALGERSRFA